MAKEQPAQIQTTTKLIITKVMKRTGEIVDFNEDKIVAAAHAALKATTTGNEEDAKKIATKVIKHLKKLAKDQETFIPHVETIQDVVEQQLMVNDYFAAAKAFIIYRQQRKEMRDNARLIQLEASEGFKSKVKESKIYFKNNKLGEFVYYTAYSRWLEEKGRRETWVETIDRFVNFMKYNLKEKLSEKEYIELREGLLNQEVIPSMRLVWSSGKAADATHVAAYNCSFISVTSLKDFSEAMYISMCGCGVGFSVEESSIQKLPEIQLQTGKKKHTHVVEDSKEGWADALLVGMETWFAGEDIEFDYSKIRPKGSRLATMGGRASGPEPLMDLMVFARQKVLSNQGSRLSSIDVHDIMCKVGQIVVAGGVRRSAMISLSDFNDEAMRNAKHGQFWVTEPQRSMANNSAIYNKKPSAEEFLEEWLALIKSKSGERGIFNRGKLLEQLPERRAKNFKEYVSTSGTNPCGEIILRSRQFCNLTAIVVRADDNKESLLRKIRLATILGTYQATLTKFPYLSPEWQKNCEEEALLGVSFTGYYDNEIVRDPKILESMRDEAVKVNKKYAKKFGINESTCVTCVKPSGNSSQLLDTSSGMHPRYAKYYIRRVRVNAIDPIFKMPKDQGVPYNPEVGQTQEDARTFVLEFPVEAPDDAIVKDDVSALDLLEEWKKIKVNFTEHNPSATIYVSDSEWLSVGNWVYENWDIVGGLSFLPRNDHVYQLAPYEEINKDQYEELVEQTKNVDFSKLVYYEVSDNTEGAKEYACVGGACEI